MCVCLCINTREWEKTRGVCACVWFTPKRESKCVCEWGLSKVISFFLKKKKTFSDSAGKRERERERVCVCGFP